MSIVNEEMVRSNSSIKYSATNTNDSSNSDLKRPKSIGQTGIQLNLITLATAIRLLIFGQIYPLSPAFKKIAWIILILWTIICSIVAILFGLQFDLKYDEIKINDIYKHKCWDLYMSLRIESELNQQYINSEQNALDSTYSDNYSNINSDSQTWLLSLMQSLLTSILIWQPLSILILTYVKVWMFVWNLKMDISISNVFKLCRKCCSCNAKKETKLQGNLKLNLLTSKIKSEKMNSKNRSNEKKNSVVDSDMIINESSLNIIGFLCGFKTTTTVDSEMIINERSQFIANSKRPRDIIGFLCDDDLFVDDYDIEIADQIKNMRPNKMVIQTKKCKHCGNLMTENKTQVYCNECASKNQILLKSEIELLSVNEINSTSSVDEEAHID
eukprot:236699_1